MRAFVFIALLALASPSHAYTCADVRSYVAQYGWAKAVAYAATQLTPEQRRQALACFRKSKR